MTRARPGSGRPRLAPPWAVALGVFAALFVLLTALDRTIVLGVADPGAWMNPSGWRWGVKQVGDLRFWLAVGIVAFAWKRDWRWPAGLLGAATLGGGLAEIAKLILGRERPVRDFVLQHDAHYVWKDGPLGPFLAGFWDSTNLGLPSSHAAVAFAGSAMLGLLDRGLRPAALALAGACGMSRILAGAHFPTDVLLGAGLGGLGAVLVARLGRPRGGAPDAGTIPPHP